MSNNALFQTRHMIYKTADRLKFYREQAKASTNEHYKDWRKHVRPLFKRWNIDRNQDGSIVWIHSKSASVFQFVDYADKIIRLDHTGWYADHDYCELYRACVFTVKTTIGPCYIQAYENSDSGEFKLFMDHLTFVPKTRNYGEHQELKKQTLRDVASYADHNAERDAELARDYRAKDLAEQDIELAKERIHEINQDALELIREIKHARKLFTPAVCRAIHAQLQVALKDRTKQFKTISERQANYWSAVS